MIRQVSLRRKLTLSVMAGLCSATIMSFATGLPDTVGAAKAEPSANNTYNYLQIARPNTFRVYARPGEVIHFKVGLGYTHGGYGGDSDLCARIGIYDSTDVNNPISSGGIRIDRQKLDGTTTVDTSPTSAISSTCTAASEYQPYAWVTISYRVPNTKLITQMDHAYYLKFMPMNGTLTSNSTSDTASKWQVSVNNTLTSDTTPTVFGRTWVVGDDAGLTINQQNRDGGGSVERELDFNATDHTFVFARTDGYKYVANYFSYHGIVSFIHGGVYGVRLTTTRESAHRSYPDQSSTDNPYFDYSVQSSLGGDNTSYIFVDCAPANVLKANCPSGLGAYSGLTSLGYNIIRDLPMTRSGTVTSGSNTYINSPIAEPNNSATATSGFRYTGYTATNLVASASGAAARVTIPYYGMQTGSIRLTVIRHNSATNSNETMCVRDFVVDDADGGGVKYWDWPTSAPDTNCGSGTLRTTAVSNIPSSDTLDISALPIRLGEMHFVERDTEERGGITVRSNNATNSTLLAWYDPFSRKEVDTCGRIPPRIGVGAPALGVSGMLYSNDTTWDSMSSSLPSLSRINLYDTTSQRDDLGNPDRQMVDSNVPGGVHGWFSASDCDAAGSKSTSGHAYFDGTATDVSTWGNNRAIDDWTYDNAPQKVLSISVGGVISQWNIDGSVRAYSASSGGLVVTTVRPGDTVYFDYRLWNSGPDTSGSITYSADGSPGLGSPRSLNAGENIAVRNPLQSVTIPLGAANGSTICKTLAWVPDTQNGGNGSATGCVTVQVGWSIGGSVTPYTTQYGSGNIVAARVDPSETVYFDYHIWNNGPDSTNSVDISSWIDTVSHVPPLTLNAGQNVSAYDSSGGWQREAVTPPSTARNGDSVCRTLTWSPIAIGDNGTGMEQACVPIQYNYELTPVASVASEVLFGQPVTFNYSVSIDHFTSNDTNWSVRSIIIPPGSTILDPTYKDIWDASARTCAYYTQSGNISNPAAVTCTDNVISSASPVVISSVNSPGWITSGSTFQSETVGGSYTVGTMICRQLIVDSRNQNDPSNPRGSALACAVVSAKPYVSVIGGDVWAGGSATVPYTGISNIDASPTLSAGFGSFGEYGVFATGSINFFGSAARFSGASTTANVGAVDGAKLTFGSMDSSLGLGKFTSTHRISDMVANMCPGGLSGSLTLASGGQLTMDVSSSKTPICATRVDITNNIVYNTAGAGTFGELPSLTVIANEIYVTGNVTEVAGNFYAINKFVTCREGEGVLSNLVVGGSCMTSGTLTINGSVTVADHAGILVLNRTFGGMRAGEPAEVIRMRPEVFLTPFENNRILQTVLETELPARY